MYQVATEYPVHNYVRFKNANGLSRTIAVSTHMCMYSRTSNVQFFSGPWISRIFSNHAYTTRRFQIWSQIWHGDSINKIDFVVSNPGIHQVYQSWAYASPVRDFFQLWLQLVHSLKQLLWKIRKILCPCLLPLERITFMIDPVLESPCLSRDSEKYRVPGANYNKISSFAPGRGRIGLP